MSIKEFAKNAREAYFTLPNGDKIPSIGLGTWRSGKDETKNAVCAALKAGYRHIDTAHIYGNEKEIGEGIRESGVPRTDIWVTSKLWCNAHRAGLVPLALEKTLQDLNLEYIDAYLIHWPFALLSGPEELPRNEKGELIYEDVPIEETWQAMEELLETGKVRYIGISNFNNEYLDRVLKIAKVKPTIHQMELHPYLPQTEYLEKHKKLQIHVSAYSPLANQNDAYNSDISKLIEHKTLVDIANARGEGITPANIAISWAVKRGTSVLPKSVNESRIVSNFLYIPLTDKEMEAINNIGVVRRFSHGKFAPKPMFVGLQDGTPKQTHA
ncbi:Glucose 1-dehydrogenase [Schizosaccharomyces pombe]|uniref:Uncharacterized oxidoreductase C8E4.04 n=1 Tax=Schizosaccharomyces pombe (strain 972 / ATCC 24843) TaxID=284812 RepID=YBN4_SCHPO|nr:putative aldo/keto reductase [Schizosaccharomyces pombe]O42888.1 RecName: Full=Uncharacterized oxidoreductase C8E4.04 [Schizosaccharomyces pombe 972h-]CAA16997.1 aldo/keto reductase involved in pentose catabolism (predicted) [Schizosaccharomyces pombe]|eukprot:NP_596843.1 putative aldo/keto reductase [Schizosaccharomyces pombe]